MTRALIAAVSLVFFTALHAQPATLVLPEPSDGAPGSPATIAPPKSSDGAPRSPTTIAPPESFDGAQGSSSTWSYMSRGTAILWASARSEMGTLGQYCNGDVGFCVWILMLRNVQCTHGEEHPILLNTDQLAAPHVIRCVGSIAGRGATFAFTDFDSIDEAVRGAQQLAIAVPEQGDKIVVTHFPLAGATAALAKLREALGDQNSSESSSAGRPGNDNKEKPARLPTRREAQASA